jgi:hypothetical protein
MKCSRAKLQILSSVFVITSPLSVAGHCEDGNELAFYETTVDSCQCGETCFAEGMYRMPVRCSHRLAVDPHPIVIPAAQDIPVDALVRLELDDGVDWSHGCILHIEVVEGLQSRPVNNIYRQWEVERLVKKIVKEAHASTKRDEIHWWVEENLQESDEFAIGDSRSFHQVHMEGVRESKTAPRGTPATHRG